MIPSEYNCKFLIIQPAFIGDVILATPLIRKIKEAYPSAIIDFMLRKDCEGLLANNTAVRKILVWNKQHRKYNNLISLILFIKKENYDFVINIQRFASAGLITALSGAKNTIGFKKNPLSIFFNKSVEHKFENGIHEVLRNLKLIEHLTDSALVKPELFPSENDYKYVERYSNNKYICIAPASIWHTKQLSANKWAELINKTKKEYKIYLIGSKKDITFCDEIICRIDDKKNITVLCGELSVLQSAALMKNAKMNYVNDSAPLHITSAVNAPVTAVFCSTSPSFGFGPLSDNSKIVEAKEVLKCKPCGIHGTNSCPEKHFKCSEDISIEEMVL